MIRPRFHLRLLVLIAFAAIGGLRPASRAEQPPVPTQPPAESKSAPAPRAKPQIIYHLPRTSTYAATLHSQAKGQSNALPIDSSMPISLQISRAAANQAQEEPSASPGPSKSTEAARQSTLKRSKMPSNRSHIRSHASPKGHGPGNSPGNKSHKK
jgi:hypothetical protein